MKMISSDYISNCGRSTAESYADQHYAQIQFEVE